MFGTKKQTQTSQNSTDHPSQPTTSSYLDNDDPLDVNPWARDLVSDTEGSLSSKPVPNNPGSGRQNIEDISANQDSQGLAQREEHTQQWILLCFPYEKIVKVVHIEVPDTRDDKALFARLRQEHLKVRSRWARFFQLRAVTGIHFAKVVYQRGVEGQQANEKQFRLTTEEFAGIPKTGVWPCSLMSPVIGWSYTPCPMPKDEEGKPDVPVSASWMLHLWNYPDHVAAMANTQRSTTIVAKTLARLGLQGRFCSINDAGNDVQNIDNGEDRDNDETVPPILAPGRAAVLETTPKKLGDKLAASIPISPPGWGLYFEEGFRISWALLGFLAVYLFASLTFGVAWYVEHGSSPVAGLGSFGVSSWMVGLFSLILTIWFAMTQD